MCERTLVLDSSSEGKVQLRALRSPHAIGLGIGVALGAVAGEPALSAAQLPDAIYRTVSGRHFVANPSVSGEYGIAVPADTLYGFKGTSTVGVYVDLYAPSGTYQYQSAQVCRQSYSGTTVVCGTAASGSWSGSYSVSLSTSGLNGTANNVWDYYYATIQFPQGPKSNLVGLGSQLPRCW